MPDGSRLLIASNRLPFTVQSGADGLELRPTTGGLASALSAVHQRGDHIWVGWPGECPVSDEYTRAELIGRLHARRVVPVMLSHAEVRSYYDGVCNSVLWPVLHYLLDRMPVSLPGLQPYRTVNERFAETLIAQYQPGDILWIHDYHLLLAPALIRARIPEARIGFFLHTPFPAADVFRVLPWRRELLDGMLGATVIGFQTTRDAANFADAVRLLTEYAVDDASVLADGRRIRFGAYPIGVDVPPVEGAAAPVPDRFPVGGCRRLLGVDRLDYTKGIVSRLAAFDRLLTNRPQLAGQVEFLQVAVPSREAIPSYADLGREVEALVQQINARFGTRDWTPVHYIRESVSPAELAALYCSADVMLVTSLRDGMNLVAREFVLAREDCDGVLVLSELAGASEDLRSALLVNPYAVDDIADAMSRALDLEAGERRRRMKALRQRVSARTIDDWVQRFTADVACVTGDCQDADRSLVATINTLVPERPIALAVRYEGLLADSPAGPAPADPDPELLDLLRGLAGRDGLTLHLISAFDHKILDRWFDMLPAVIWAEDGLWRREREGHRWRRTQWASGDWMDDVRELLQQFVARTPGAFVEESGASLRWHFGRSEHVLGCTQAQTLAVVLRDGADALGYDVLVGDAVVEIRPAGLSTDRTVQKIIELDPEAHVVLLDTAAHLEAARQALRPGDLRVTVGDAGAPGVTILSDARSLRRVLAEVGVATPAPPSTLLFHGRPRTRPRYVPADAAAMYMSRGPAGQVRIGR